MENRNTKYNKKIQEFIERSNEIDPWDINSTSNLVIKTAIDLFGAKSGTIIPINPITGRYKEPQILNFPIGDFEKDKVFPLPDSKGVTAEIIREGKIIVEDVSENEKYQNPVTKNFDINAYVGFALYPRKKHDKALAVIFLNYENSQRFDKEFIEVLDRYVKIVSATLEKTWQIRRLWKVERLGREIKKSVSSYDILKDILLEKINGILNIEQSFALLVYVPQKKKWLCFGGGKHYNLPDSLPVDKLQLSQRVLLQKEESWRTDNIWKEPSEIADIRSGGIEIRENTKSLLCVPMIENQPLTDGSGEKKPSKIKVHLGVLLVQHSNAGVFGDEDQRLCEIISNTVATSLSNIRLNQKLRHLDEYGRKLLQRLDSKDILKYVTKLIVEATQANSVILYLYDVKAGKLGVPPFFYGDLRQPKNLQRHQKEDDLTLLIFKQREPVFAFDSSQIYTLAGGDASHRFGNFVESEGLASSVGMPLLVSDEQVGVLFINFRNPQPFDQAQKRLITGLGNYAALAIKNSFVYASKIKQRVHELNSLREIDKAMTEKLDRDYVLETILEKAFHSIKENIPETNLNDIAGAIALRDEQKNELILTTTIGRKAKIREGFRIQLKGHPDAKRDQHGLVRRAFERKATILTGNIKKEPELQRYFIDTMSDTLSELDVPLIDKGGEVIGVLNFESRKEKAFNEGLKHFFEVLAGQVVIAIRNVQAFEREQRISEHKQLLIDTANQVAGDYEKADLFRLILNRALKLSDSGFGNILFYDDEGKLSIIAKGNKTSKRFSIKELRQSMERGIAGEAKKHKKTINVGNVKKPPWNKKYVKLIEEDIHSELAVPIYDDERVWGVINIEAKEADHFDKDDERILEALSGITAVSLQNATRFEKLKAEHNRLNTIRKIEEKIIEILDDPDQVIEEIIKCSVYLTNGDSVNLDLYDDDSGAWVKTYYGIKNINNELSINSVDLRLRDSPKFQRGIMKYVAETKQPYLTKNTEEDRYFVPMEGIDIKSEMAAPLLSGDRIKGVISVGNKRKNAFDEEVHEFLNHFGHLNVIAIQQAQHYAKAQEEGRRFEQLYKAARALGKISSLSDLEKAYDIILERADIQDEKSEIVVRQFDPTSQSLKKVKASKRQGEAVFEEIKITEPKSVNAQVAREKRTIVVPDVNNPPEEVECGNISDPRTQTLVVVPIFVGGSYFGNFALGHPEAGFFQNADVELIEGLTQLLGQTIYQLKTIESQQSAERREREGQTMADIGQSAMRLAHRLGNELGLIETWSNLIRPIIPKQASEIKYLDKIVARVKNVLKISKGLREAMSQDTSIDKLREVVDINKLLDDLVDSKSQDNEKVKFTLLQGAENAKCLVSKSQIEEIFLNLFSNAIEVMPDGGEIRLETREKNDTVEIDITDNGKGIPKENWTKVFVLFFSTKKSSGFGLWSSKRLALENGGDLKIHESEPGKGTTFTLTLPINWHSKMSS